MRDDTYNRKPSPVYGDEPREAPGPAREGYSTVVVAGVGRHLPPGLGPYAEAQRLDLGGGQSGRQLAIPAVLHGLDLAVPAAFEALHRLEARLEPVLRVGPLPGAVGGGQANPRAALPPLAERLTSLADAITDLAVRIDQLVDRVEV